MLSRRELLQTCLAATALPLTAAATTTPLLGLIAPPANYPVPPEGLTLYGSDLRFTVFGLGLPTMTPEGYDSVIDKIVPAARQQAKEGANAISIFGTSLTFYKGAAFNQKLINDVHKATGLPTTSMSTAVVEGLRASCGGLRTLELLAPLERQCGVPVVSSTPHALWAGMRVLGLHVKAPGYGQLLAKG